MNSISTQQLTLGSGLLTATGNSLYLNQNIISSNSTPQSGITGTVTINQSFNLLPILNQGALSLASSPFYINTGVIASNWTLPSLSSTLGRLYFIKNRGGAITLSGQFGDNLFPGSPALTFTIGSGESYIVGNGNLYWEIM